MNTNLLRGDCLELLATIPDKSVDLVLTDPPYNIKLADWDTWETVNKYIEFMTEVFKHCERVLKDNGSLYFFHNDIEQIARLMESIRINTAFNFNSFITWDKGDWRAQAWKYPTENNNLRSWFNTCEYCLYYNKRSCVSTEWDKTGWERVHLDINNFKPLRDYVKNMLDYIGKNARRDILESFKGPADHFLRYSSTQWSLPTEETYNKIIDKYNLRTWENFKEYEELRKEYEELRKEYEELRKEYEELRFTHNLDYGHKNVFNYRRDTGTNYHPCQKPQALLTRLIKCSTNEGDLILDCFAGSGSTGVAAVNTNRDFIGIERDENYINIAQKRINDAKGQPSLFY